MSISFLRRFVLIASFLLISCISSFSANGMAQDSNTTTPLIDVTLETGSYPVAPAFVRLLRIVLEPGASSPLHTHPGPEIALIERGTATVQVGGPAKLVVAGDSESADTPATETMAPVLSDFEMTAGDRLVYLPQTSMTFRNAGTEPVSILTVVLLPAGHQHPPGVTYINGQPASDAFAGVTPQILGDGVASSMPANGIRITVDQLDLGTGEAIPASSNQVMLSLKQGSLDFEVVSGKMQVSRGATPGPQADSAPGTEDHLAANDALYFPLGMKEAARPADAGPVAFMRLTIAPAGPESDATPTSSGAGEIRVMGIESAQTTEITTGGTPQTGAPTPAPAASPTPTTSAEPGEGDTATINSEDVNVRACASIDCDAVTQVYTGQTVTILGEPEEGDGYIWWPISLDDDPSITGYVVQEFLDLPNSNG